MGFTAFASQKQQPKLAGTEEDLLTQTQAAP